MNEIIEKYIWEKEFDKKFSSIEYMDNVNDFEVSADEDVKDFIKELLEWQKKEIIKNSEKLKKDFCIACNGENVKHSFSCDAIDEVIKTIKDI